MGSRKSSSKKKSSKKKRTKISSKIRKRKSRRNKSKKFSSSEDDTSSSASSDYSSSPQSLSSSSEDDDSRKSRRHSRDVKHVKKRTRRRSSSRDVYEGSPLVKKRKKSNRKSLDYGRKVQKKKRRRHTSISSKRSDSRSCSSCRCETSISSRGSDCTSGSEDIDLKSPRIKSRKGMKEKRICNEPSIEKRSGSRGPTCSSCNHQSCSCNTTHSGKGYVEENNSKRLRSVITVPEKTHEKEGDERGTDMVKEEILNKHHDFPSCRNHDNNDLESKNLASCSCLSSDQTMQVENLIIADAVPPNRETIGPTKVGGGIDTHPNKVKEVSRNNGGESVVSDSNANSGFEDLETLLRKKALENLQKFRKELQTNLKSGAKEEKNDSDVNQLSPSRTAVAPYKSLEQENKEGLALNQVIGCRSKLVTNKEFPHSTKIEISTPVEKNNGKGTGYIKESITQPSDKSALSQSPEKEDHTTAPLHIDEPELGKPSCSTKVQTYKKEDPLASKRNINKTPDPLRPGVLSTVTSNNLGMGGVNASIRPNVETSSVRSTSEGLTSKHQPDGTKDGSQFEQKTMSVMRGGEMVQVNYKVYIPKRAPALARRQLKR